MSLPLALQPEAPEQLYFILLCVGSLLVTYVASLLAEFRALSASDRLHTRALDALSRASLRFFDQNPSGRILNRFSKDLAVLEATLPFEFTNLLQLLWQTVAFLLLSFYAFPLLILFAVPLFALLLFSLGIGLIATADSLRWESISRSPIHSLLAVVLGGLPSFRSQKAHFFG